MEAGVPAAAAAAVLLPSAPVSDAAVSVQGPDFDYPQTLQSLLQSYERIGFQANSLGKAINVVNQMVGIFLVVTQPPLNHHCSGHGAYRTSP